MNAGFKYSFYPAAALAAAVLFGVSEVVVPLLGGPVNFNSPIGVPALLFAGITPDGAVAWTPAQGALARHFFIAAKAVLVTAYLVLLALQLAPRAARWPGRNGIFIIGQLLAVLAIDSLALHLIVAAQLAACMPRRRGLGWLGVQIGLAFSIDMGLLTLLHADTGRTIQLITNVSLERGVIALAFGIALLVRSERRASLALAASHAELLGTQALLADTVRSSERLRIARDLHDVAGHHLTALNLHLDLALRQLEHSPAAGTPAGALRTSRELAQDLLAQVRAMVGTERREQPIDLHAALHSLCAGIPQPRIELRVDASFATHSPALAQTLFCCVREAVTNALRHAQAQRVKIDLRSDGGEVALTVVDDGCGGAGRPEGHGLRGMRERLLQHGGVLAVNDAASGGFGLSIRIPRQGACA